jgi:predicted ATP-dependent endonuclease of OLD family
MKIRVKNLGMIRQAEIELGKLSVICGANNSGKTYITYAIFGFLNFWHNEFSFPIDISYVKTLQNEGVVSLDLKTIAEDARGILDNACKEYTRVLPKVYAAQERLFENSSLEIDLETDFIEIPSNQYEQEIKTSAGKVIFTLRKEFNSNELVVTLLSDESVLKINPSILQRAIGDSVRSIIFNNLLPSPFIASAERTGAAIFRKELNFARNRLLKQLSSNDKTIDPIELLRKEKSDYALPVEMNVDFSRDFETLSKKTSYISESYPGILESFTDIIGGDYQVNNKTDELYFVPKNAKVKLTMDESSSAVRSLSLIGFYLRHTARKGEILIIDEPELNLHPENQRKVARLNIFITTHSDYIIKEFNTLIMLNSKKEYIELIKEQEGYFNHELLSTDDLRVYIAGENLIKLDGKTRASKCQTLIASKVTSEQGIEAVSFDSTIDDMNRIQEAIIFGGE